MRQSHFIPIQLALCALAACSPPDYSAVREWGRSADLATAYPLVVGRSMMPAEAAALHGDILMMQKALSTYLSALATVASDGVLPLREDPFTDLAPALAARNAAAGQAVAELGRVLRRASHAMMRAPQTDDFITEADPAVQAILAELLSAVQGAFAATGQAATPTSGGWTETGDTATGAPSRGVQASQMYLAVLQRMAEGHELLRLNSRHLTREEVARIIRASEDKLHRALALLAWITFAGPAAEPAIAGLVSPGR